MGKTAETNAGQPGGDPTAGGATLVVSNRTGRSLWFFHARPQGREAWGPELLDSVLMDGSEEEVRLPIGVYDLRAETGDGTRIGETGVRVTGDGPVTWVVELE